MASISITQNAQPHDSPTRAIILAANVQTIDRKNRASAAHDSKEKAQLAPGFPTIRDLELLDYITTVI
jgi:hypothetical protein